MIVAWMWQALVVGTLVAVGAFGVDGLARLVGRPMRWGWLAALGLTVGLVAIAPLRARPGAAPMTTRPLASPLGPSQAAPTIPVVPRWSLSTLLAAQRRYVSSSGRLLDASLGWVQRHAPSMGRWMIVLWCASTIGLLALLCAVEWRFRRARAAWPLAELHGVSVRVAPEAGPAVIGVRHPEIVVPRWLLARDVAAQRLVIAHEREHIRSGDPALLAAGWAAVVLLPWHPAVWWMAARMRLAVEMDCDMRLLRHGVVPRTYGTLLIDLAAECSGLGAGAPAFSDRPTQLERRLSAMMPMKSTVRRFARLRGSAVALLAVAAIAAACEARMPTAADVRQMDATSAVYAARQVGFVGGNDKNTHYTVNGHTVSADSARAVRSDSVAQIDVVKCHSDSVTVRYVPGTSPSNAAGGCSISALIAITTNGHMAPFAANDLLDSIKRFTIRRESPSPLQRGDSSTAGPTTTKLLHGTVAGVPVTRMSSAPTQLETKTKLDSAMHVQVGATNPAGGPMFVLDGVKITRARAEAFLGLGGSANVSISKGAANVESIEVIKGAAAMKLYSDPEAANGVILIKTKP